MNMPKPLRRLLLASAACALFDLAGAALAAEAPPAGPPPESAIFPPVRDRTLEVRDLRSKSGLDYRITISRPEGPPPAGGFPVLYVVDGNAWAGVTTEIVRLNEPGGGPAVVVGIGYPTKALFDMRRRVFDMTPPNSPKPQNAFVAQFKTGGGDQFLRFIQDELKPQLAAAIPLNPHRQALIGHSLGGWFTLHVLLTEPGDFQTYVAASPAIHFDTSVLDQAKALGARPDRPKDLKVLLAVGDREQNLDPEYRAQLRTTYAAHPELLGGMSPDAAVADTAAGAARERMVDNARDMTANLVKAGIDARFALFPMEDHLAAAPPAINRGVPLFLTPPQ